MAKKECPDCGLSVGVRTKNCPDCGWKFRIIKRGPKPKQINWKELKRGDIIKCVQGTGPYYVCTRGSEESDIGDKIYMGCKGKYEVVRIVGNGLLCKGLGNKSCGLEFLYMGNKELSKSTGIFKEPHRLIKIKTRKRK